MPAPTSNEQKILSTIAYFDTQDFPCTAVECAEWSVFGDGDAQPRNPVDRLSVGTVSRILAELSENGILGTFQGFFFFRGRENLVWERKRRERIAWKKERRARRAVFLLRFIPSIRYIALCNTMAWRAAKDESDIDVFIVTRVGRIWTARFLAVAILHVFGLRRHGARIKDRICLSFFATEDSLDFSKIAVGEPNAQFQKFVPRSGFPLRGEILNRKSEIFDIYLCYWIASLRPLLDRAHIHQKIAKENAWVFDRSPNFLSSRTLSVSPRFCLAFLASVSHLSRLVFASLERFFRFLQLKKMKFHAQGERPVPSAVIISEQMLKFHEEDRRLDIQNEWKARFLILKKNLDKSYAQFGRS